MLHTPGATLIEQWHFFKRPFRAVDKVVGIAPVKNHNLCYASLGIEIWYGLLGARRNQFHQDIHEIVSDLSIMIRPTLTIKSLFRINRIVERCTDCNLCLMHCEGASDPHTQARTSECFGCMNCIDDCPENALEFTMLGQDKSQVVAGPDLNRRQVAFAGFAGLMSVPMLRNNGRINDENFSPLMMRPPGSVAEAEFMERCIKCDQCLNVCPTNVLQPATLEEGGIEELWTPVMHFNIAHCQLKCT
jgi:ferredoxin